MLRIAVVRSWPAWIHAVPGTVKLSSANSLDLIYMGAIKLIQLDVCHLIIS